MMECENIFNFSYVREMHRPVADAADIYTENRLA